MGLEITHSETPAFCENYERSFDYYTVDRQGVEAFQALPPYSTDMNAAMKVVKAVCGAWDKFELHYETGRWFAIFSRSGTDERIAVGADTPALAVCLAALEVVK